MNTFTLVLRNSAYTLIAFCIISILAHFVYAFIDYKNKELSFYVKKKSTVKTEDFKGLKFTNNQTGKLEIKPTIIQAVLLENRIFKDGGSTMLFYLISCFGILKIIKRGSITFESLTEKTIAKFIWAGAGLFFVLKLSSAWFLDKYINNLTMGGFEHYDNSNSFFSLWYLAIVVFNAVYGLIQYTRKLKQENDLTI